MVLVDAVTGLTRMRGRALVRMGPALLAAGFEVSALPAQDVGCAVPDSVPAGETRHRESCLVLLEGVQAFRRGEYEAAAHKFEESLWMSVAVEPGRKEYWLGRALLAIGKTREAAFAFYRALRAEERAAAADTALLGSIRLGLAKANDVLGKRDAALGWYQAVLESPASPSDKEEARRYLAESFHGEPAAPEGTPVAELRTILRDLAAAEDGYRSEHGIYTDDLTALGLSAPSGAQLVVNLVEGGAGYVAEARSVDGAYVCQVRSGRGARPRDHGVVQCAGGPRSAVR